MVIFIFVALLLGVVIGYFLGQKFSTNQSNDDNHSQNDKPGFDEILLAKLKDQKLTESFNNVELLGGPIQYDAAKEYVKLGHDERKILIAPQRGVDTSSLEQSIYFSRKELNDWTSDLAKSLKIFKKHIGYRFYFAKYPSDYKNGSSPYANQSTLVIRAMRSDGEDIEFVKKEDTDVSIAYNFGSVCPPVCFPKDPKF